MLKYVSKNQPLNADESLQNARCIYEYLTSVAKWTPNAVCGLLGNTYCESKNNPGAWQSYKEGNSSGGYGIVQWTPARKYLQWVLDNGYTKDSMEAQLLRLVYELKEGIQFYKTKDYPVTFNQFITSKESPEYLAEVFVYNYERPNSPNVELRRIKASEYFTLFTSPTKEVGDSSMFEKEKQLIDWAKSKLGPSDDKPKCGYVWGSGGEVLTEKNLETLYKRNPTHVDKSIVKKWLGKQVFDCATFVREGLESVGIPFTSGASTSWNKTSHWVIKGPISGMPMGHACVVYKEKPDSNPMGHTGLYVTGGKTIHAYGSKSGVIDTDDSEYAWTHFGIPVGLYTPEELKIVLDGIVKDAPIPENPIGKFRVLSPKWLNVRASKSTASKDLGDLQGGQVVDYYADDGTWLTIRHNGQLAYVVKKYTDDIEDAPDTGIQDEESSVGFPKTMTVTAPKAPLNVRNGPSLKGTDVIGVLQKGTRVTVIEIQGTWANIEWSWATAWVSAKYLV